MDNYRKANFIDEETTKDLLNKVISFQAIHKEYSNQVTIFYIRLAGVLGNRSFTSMEFVSGFVSSLLSYLPGGHPLVPLLLQAGGHFAKELTADDLFAEEVEEIMQQYFLNNRFGF
jgi:hypothetical protein